MDDDSIYMGQWKNGVRYGYGISVWENASWYEGEWVNDVFHGNGTFYYNEGDVY